MMTLRMLAAVQSYMDRARFKGAAWTDPFLVRMEKLETYLLARYLRNEEQADAPALVPTPGDHQ